jgi:4-amino-4-deoxy-L-arabinose transferase-like glycosyltransferase
MEINTELETRGSDHRWWREWEVAAIALLVVAVYFTRLAAIPICGEESRWATAAREMITSGDWIVPRQQGTVFPERPPLGSWAMALVGLARGEVDLVAVRLPSALATLAMTLLIYAYARSAFSRLGGFSAAVIYATFGQVLPLGRLGETEAIFTLFAGGALLVWQWGYACRWSAAATWSVAWSLAALGALAKGLQAPVYLLLVSSSYLALRRDWRFLLAPGHALGLGCFAAIVGAWLVPFAVSESQSIADIWAGLARDRFTTEGLWRHLASYPFETLGCLLPWSPLLFAFLKPSIRRAAIRQGPVIGFLLVAFAVTYPSVWLAAGARGRYFMPLYPCLAVLLGWLVEHCADAAASLEDRRVWRLFLRGMALTLCGGAVVMALATAWPINALAAARQPLLFLAVWTGVALGGAAILVWASFGEHAPRPRIALVTLSSLAGLAFAGAQVNARVNGGNDLQPTIADVKEMLRGEELVSLGRVYHRFTYSYGESIRQVAWPDSADELPPEVIYFCYDQRMTDTAEVRASSDGRSPGTTAGKLPFEWEKIAEIPADPAKRAVNVRTVVVGRVKRPEMAARPDVSRPVLR